jgi:hypothetical protein
MESICDLADAARAARMEMGCATRAIRSLPGEPVALEPITLTDTRARALAELLPLLLCGEESAVLAFAHHAQADQWGPGARQDFIRIEVDEARHTEWLHELRASLPAPREDSRLRTRMRYFFMRLSSPDLGIHLGQIAALDSAVCLILGRLRRTRACGSDARVTRIFANIHRDEARHVAIARNHAREVCSARDLLACAVETRERLTALLYARGQEFDTLEVCPDALLRQLRRPPRRLFK